MRYTLIEVSVMPDYKTMYHVLFNKITDLISELQSIQRQTEELYIIGEEQVELNVLELKKRIVFPLFHQNNSVIKMLSLHREKTTNPQKHWVCGLDFCLKYYSHSILNVVSLMITHVISLYLLSVLSILALENLTV